MSTTITTSNDNTYKWLLAWLILLVLLTVFNQTKLGHVIIYYSLALMLFFLVVTQYKFIATALGPLGNSVPNGQN